jgi:hypothetical protein
MIATLASRTPMCATVANSPKRHFFFSDKSLVLNCSPPNMVLTKKQRKDGDWCTFYTSKQRLKWKICTSNKGRK